jgi:hypothetical protein
MKHNAAPEWQARNLQREPGSGGGLYTRGDCYAKLPDRG